MKILECSSRGDKRFSAFYARVSMWNIESSIEEHYQLCKRFRTPYGIVAPRTIKEAKGREPDHIELNGRIYHISFLSLYYKLLWLRYLDLHPELVQHASQFDDFNDMFRGKSINCQADVIRQYVKEGRESLWQDCLPLWDSFKSKH